MKAYSVQRTMGGQWAVIKNGVTFGAYHGWYDTRAEARRVADSLNALAAKA